MPSARPSATATIRPARRASRCRSFSGLRPHAARRRRRRRRPRRRLGAARPRCGSACGAASARGGLVGRLVLGAGLGLAGVARRRGARASATVGSRLGAPRPSARPRRSPSAVGLGGARGVVAAGPARRLLRPDVAALADAGALADAAAQVVELGAADVAAGGDLDALDLRRVHRERALHADAEGLLAHGEGLAHAVALALDDDALEDLGAAAGALDDLEVDAHAVAGLEVRDAAQLRALEAFDDGAHGKRSATGSEAGRRASGAMVAERGCSSPAPALARCGSRRHSRIARVVAGEQHLRHAPAAVLGRARVVRVLRARPRAPR